MEVSKIELAKALKSIKSVVRDEEYEQIKQIVISTEREQEIENAITGLSEEDEFALICKLMGTATSLVGLEQRPIIKGNNIIPDFIARFRPDATILRMTKEDFSEFNCLIEVKSTSEARFKIGGSRLIRLRNFADTLSLPLIFAVRFIEFKSYALWVLVEDDRKGSTIKVEIGDMLKGCRSVLFDEYGLMLHPKIHIVATYDKLCTDVGVTHRKYGTLTEMRILAGEKQLSFSGNDAVVYMIFLESFELKEVQVMRKNGKTLQVLQPNFPICFLMDIIYRMNNLLSDDEGNIVYNPSKILARSDIESNTGRLVDRQIVEMISDALYKNELLFLMGMGDEKDYLEKWRRLGNVE